MWPLRHVASERTSSLDSSLPNWWEEEMRENREKREKRGEILE